MKLHALDPGDTDTSLHALAIPDADPAALKRPEAAADEIIATLLDLLPSRVAPEARKAS